jgi:DNA-binding NarL/FixJ family response regulator
MTTSGGERRIRLLIVEDHAAVRAGIRALLEKAEDIEVVGEAIDGGQAVEMANQHLPDFILLDMELPVLRGDEVMRRTLSSHPEVRILVLSSYNDPEYIKGMLAGGARGYLLKEDAPSFLLAAIRSIHADSVEAWLSPKIAESTAFSSSLGQELSWRELAILQHLSEGLSRTEIATALDLTLEQIDKHLRVLMRKFDATSVSALVSMARHTGRWRS